MLLTRFSALMVLLATSVGAQTRQLTYVPEITIELAKHGIRGGGSFNVSRSGRIVISNSQWDGDLVALDSTGRRLLWRLPIGRRIGAEIGWVSRAGWVGDSLWVADDAFDQVVIIDTAGKIAKSIERPTWVRPFWRDRRKYPLFGRMSWEGLYPDGTMLVLPGAPRALFDTPLYDRSYQYLLRVDRDGKILRTVARVPARAAGMQLRDGTKSHTVVIPYFPRSVWKTSADGKRVAIATPAFALADSGTFWLTVLNEDGDTVFSRKYPAETRRITPGLVDTLLAGIPSFEKYSAQWIRDTVRKQIPAFASRLMNINVGVDHSIWVWMRSDKPELHAVVIDARGEFVGEARFPPSSRSTVLSVERIWRLEKVGTARGSNQQFVLVRSKLAPVTAARPSRNARASTPPRRARQPE